MTFIVLLLQLAVTLPQPPPPPKINKVECQVINHDVVTKTEVEDAGVQEDGRHLYIHHVLASKEEPDHIHCVVVSNSETAYETNMPLAQGSTDSERGKIMKRFIDIFYDRGIKGLHREYDKVRGRK